MITKRPGVERGHANHGWLDARHSFSFAGYYDPRYMGYGDLRVINEDRVAPGRGFPPHPHRDMEIVTYVLSGELAHRDSLGNGSTIRPGDVQRMSAGTGVVHSEYNASQEAPLHLLQIWIEPRAEGTAPGYEQKHFTEEERRGTLRLIADPEGAEGAVTVHQDARIYAGLLGPGQRVTRTLAPGRRAWLQVARGAVLLNDLRLEAGDGAAIENESVLSLVGEEEAEVLLFDLH